MDTNDDLDLDFDSRRLCPDGACIGLLDAAGVCKVCGRIEDRDGGPYRPAPTPNDEPIGSATEAEFADGLAGWDDRELCPDEACVGILGPDGHCRECGRARGS